MTEMTERRVAAALLILRVSLGIFLLQWSVEKFVMPEAAIRIGQNFYGVALSGIIVVILGMAETLIALALLFGIYRRWSYGLAALIHAVSVVATWRQLLNPYGASQNHLFIAGVPVLAGFILLYMLCEWDAYSVEGWRGAR
jgi:putative oxidoreductase